MLEIQMVGNAHPTFLYIVKMAGFIHISNEIGLSVGSNSFFRIVELTREYIDSSNVYTKKIYEPLDEGGLNIISLEEQETAGFMYFYHASLCALDRFKRECHHESELTASSWKELLNMLENDIRFDMCSNSRSIEL